MFKRHFLFDFDGTLVDSAPLHDRAFRETLAIEAPQTLPEFNYANFKGLPTMAAFLRLGIKEQPLLRSCIAHKRQRYLRAVRAGGLAECPGARELLYTILELGGCNYLVTSGTGDAAKLALDYLDFRKFFSGVITADDVNFGKPAPDPYLMCLARFDLPRQKSIAVEDAAAGVRSAHAAGLAVIGVGNADVRKFADWYFPGLPALGHELRKGAPTLDQGRRSRA